MFFHCFCGCDRTGELAAAYSIRHLDMSLTDALAENEQVASRHMYYDFQVSAQWYCESLRLQGLYRWDDCGNCGPYRCGDTGSPSSPKQQREQNTAVVLAASTPPAIWLGWASASVGVRGGGSSSEAAVLFGPSAC